MAGYADTRQMIIDTLMGRPAGTEIQPEDHQAFALQITDYIRSVELVAGNATPIGFADASTVPVQPDNGQAVYLSSVGGAQTVVFSNFIDQNGNAISVTSTTNVIKLVTLLWNGQYWSSQVTSVDAVRDTINGYLFMGVATPTTIPDVSSGKVFYLASKAGEYSNFGFTIPNDAPYSFKWDGTRWYAERIGDFTTPEEVEEIIKSNTSNAVTEGEESPVSGDAVFKAIEETRDALNTEILNLHEDVDGKAKKEGVYPNFVSGWSSNLTGRGDATERMFIYAPTGGDLSIGDGVARIKTIKGNSIVEDGQIKSLNVSALKTTGFNQWDEEWVVGYIVPTTGELIIGGVSATSIASKNYIPVFPDTDYYFRPVTVPRLAFYDKDKNFIKCLTSGSNGVQHTPANCHYIRFSTYSSYGKVYKNDICINLSHTGYRNGEYEPYEEHTLRLGELSKYMPLRAIPGVYDEINANEAIKRIGVVKLKDLTWGSPNADLLSKSIFNAQISDMKPQGENENETTYRKSILCNKYDVSSDPTYNTMNDKSIFKQGAAYGIVIRDTAYTTISDFVASLTDDDVVYYELTEPNEEVFAEGINLNYLANDFGTEEAIVTVDSAPFRADVIYQFNAQDRIRKNTADIKAMDGKYLAATPSGNPNHNLYTSLGAVWSDAGWQLNGVPLTNEEIDVSYLCSLPHLHRIEPNAWASLNTNLFQKFKTNFYSLSQIPYNTTAKVIDGNSIGYAAKELEVVRFQGNINQTTYKTYVKNCAYMFGNCPKLREIKDYLDVSLSTTFVSAFGYQTTSLETIWLIGLNADLDISGTKVFKKECLVYMIQKAAPTKAITIKVNADVAAWASTDPDIIAALELQPLVTLTV